MTITFKQFLIEELSHKEIFDVVEEISNNCKPYLAEIKEPHSFKLYKEVTQNIPQTGEIHNTHRDRVPTDTNPAFHKALDDWFFNKFNIRFRSHSAVFCTPSRFRLSGEACVVYPIGKINYTWSPQIADLSEYIKQKEQMNDVPNNISPEEAYKMVNQWFEEDGVEYYINTQLTHNNHCEVMIQVPSYYVVPQSTQHAIEYGLTKRLK